MDYSEVKPAMRTDLPIAFAKLPCDLSCLSDDRGHDSRFVISCTVDCRAHDVLLLCAFVSTGPSKPGGAVFHTLVPHIQRHCISGVVFSFLFFSITFHLASLSSVKAGEFTSLE